MASKKPAQPEMITPNEVAKRLGVTPNHVRVELQKGTFPVGWAYRPSGLKWVYCIPRAAFEKLMEGTYADANLIATLLERALEQLKGARVS